MVLLLGRMTNADVYSRPSGPGLDCVIAGGYSLPSCRGADGARPVCALANPADTAQGLMPAGLPMLLGAQEFWRWRPSSIARRGRPRAATSMRHHERFRRAGPQARARDARLARCCAAVVWVGCSCHRA
ncbi:MAG: hypothetical protein ACLS3M_01625 [Collinsella sp.]